MDNITYLKKVTGESDEQLLSFLLEKAKNTILAETNRIEIPQSLKSVQLDLALYFYQRQSNLGETSRNEGGVSVTYDVNIPAHIMNVIQNFRIVRIGGHAFNKEQA